MTEQTEETAEAEDNSPAYKQAVAYQVIGNLADHFGVFEHPAVQEVLDYLADFDGAKDPTPFPSTPLPPWPTSSVRSPNAS